MPTLKEYFEFSTGGDMASRIREHLRSNIYGLIAIFIALGGTAFAVNGPLPGKNQVGSADIINGEVRTQDLATGAVSTDALAPDSVTGAKLGMHSVGTSEVAPNSIVGGHVDEGTLGTVPSAVIGGYGRSAHLHQSTTCNPSSATFIDCGFTTLNLPSNARVLLIASVRAIGSGNGRCRLVSSTGGVVPGTSTDPAGDDAFALTGVTGILAPGLVDFGLECNEPAGTSMAYLQVSLSAVALSSN